MSRQDPSSRDDDASDAASGFGDHRTVDDHPGADPAPLDPIDDLASAHLDGELADADEVGRAEGDPEVMARRETFQQVSHQVGTVPPSPSVADRDDHIAAALAAAGTPTSEEPAPGTGEDSEAGDQALTSPRDEIAARRRRRRRAQPRWLPNPAVAAAVLVALAVVGLTLVLVGTGDEDAQTAQSDASGQANTEPVPDTGSSEDQASGDSGAATGESPSQIAPNDRTTGAITVADLGGFADQAELTTALGAVDPVTLVPPETGATVTLQRPAVDRCENALVAIPETDLEARTGVAAAELAGEPVVIYANRARNRPGGPVVDQLTVIEPTQCEILFAVQP